MNPIQEATEGIAVTSRQQSAIAVVGFLREALAGRALGVPELEARARAAGLLSERQLIGHAKTFKKAKKSLGIRSIRDGFGAGGKWIWVLPAQPAAPATKPPSGPDAAAQAKGRSIPAPNDPDRLFGELQGRRIPKEWLKGIASLHYDRAPSDIPIHRWRLFLNDCHKFMGSSENWAERAEKLGWAALALFGCRRNRPLEHLGSAGLVWAINGGKIIELHRDGAVIERAEDRSSRVYHRRPLGAANVTLPWVCSASVRQDE